jgi:hypothetical protein
MRKYAVKFKHHNTDLSTLRRQIGEKRLKPEPSKPKPIRNVNPFRSQISGPSAPSPSRCPLCSNNTMVDASSYRVHKVENNHVYNQVGRGQRCISCRYQNVRYTIE